jgi:protoporphyrinogen oxidase
VIGTSTGILGGGLTGLTLGSLIPDSEVLERESVVGGLCRSKVVDGFTYDIGGSHVLFSRNEATMQFIKDILGDNIEKRTRNTKVFFKGRYVKYPFENGLNELPPEDNFECLSGYIESFYARQDESTPKPNNFEEWMYYRFGKGVTEKYLLPYNEKIWKMEAKKMGLKWIDGRIPDPPIEDVIKSSLGISTEGYKHQLHFLYPRTGGIQALTDGIAERCGSLETGFDVQNVRREGDEFYVLGSGSEKRYSRLVSTIPLPNLVDCLDDVPRKVRDSAGSLKHNSLISVFLGASAPKTKDFSWVYFPEDESIFHRLSFPSNYSPEVAPQGRSCLLAEITCHVGDDIWEQSDEELVENVVRRLDVLDILAEDDMIVSDVSRMTPAYVIYDSEYDDNIRIVDEFIDESGIETCGRFGQFKYLNMDACIENAIALARTHK